MLISCQYNFFHILLWHSQVWSCDHLNYFIRKLTDLKKNRWICSVGNIIVNDSLHKNQLDILTEILRGVVPNKIIMGVYHGNSEAA